jgi:hypothetical protein
VSPTTTYEDPTTYDEDVEEDAPVQPVQYKGIERVRKMVPLGAPKEKKVVPPSSPLVPLGTPKSGAPKGGDPGGTPKKAEKQPKATPPAEQSNAPPQEKKRVPAPLVEQERKPKPRVKAPETQ